MNNYLLIEENETVSGAFSRMTLKLDLPVEIAPRSVAQLKIPTKVKLVYVGVNFNVSYQLTKNMAALGLAINHLSINDEGIEVSLINYTDKLINLQVQDELATLQFSSPLMLKTVPVRYIGVLNLNLGGS